MTQIPDEFYAIAASEITNKTYESGLMARAYSECLGDEKKTLALYLKLRANRLAKDFEIRVAEEERYRSARNQEEDEKRSLEIACSNCELEFACLNCDTSISAQDQACPKCGWSWKSTT